MSVTARLPRALYSAEQVRALDRRAMQQGGIPGLTLMQRAGASAFALLRRRWPRTQRIVVAAGAGNNAGDGYVLARLAHQAGVSVTVAQVGDASRLRGDALLAFDEMRAAGLGVSAFHDDPLASADVVVDAVFGTGLSRDVEGRWRAAIDAINGSARPVLSLDIPSGLSADSGTVHGTCVRAAHTITFVGLKLGMFTGYGPEMCGDVVFDDLDIPDTVREGVVCEASLSDARARRGLLGARPANAHKGQFGHVLVVGGNHGMVGAAAMAGQAAARSGAGLVSVATRRGNAAPIIAAMPELMVHEVEQPGSSLAALARAATVIAIGPGLGRGVWSRDALRGVLQGALPLVVDADGLNLLAAAPVRREDWVLTPHPGEAGRLLACPTGEIQRGRVSAARALNDRYGGVCVLKGAGTVISAAGGATEICNRGNPGMASGGMGDVLTGVIAALMAQGVSPWDAARVGVCVHAEAGDLAARDGQRGMLATDLLPHIRRLLNA